MYVTHGMGTVVVTDDVILQTGGIACVGNAREPYVADVATRLAVVFLREDGTDMEQAAPDDLLDTDVLDADVLDDVLVSTVDREWSDQRLEA